MSSGPSRQEAGVRDRPWDARLANRLVRPLRRSSLSPSVLTTVRLAVGLSAAAAIAVGDPGWANRGAVLFALSNFLDHTDGELARMTGRTSRAGHVYDLASDALVHVLFFVGIGYGLRAGPLGGAAPALGVVAGVSVSAIFLLRIEIERRFGKEASRLPGVARFEIEDLLYLMPLVTWAGGLLPFLVAAAIGGPLFGGWLVWRHRPGSGDPDPGRGPVDPGRGPVDPG
ncbi:MAG: CDP-alcohol phosphatidyltransferase family protein [Gemmatimonadota bacterium]